MYELKYMVDSEGELIGTYSSKKQAQEVANRMAKDMHPENAADLVIRTKPVYDESIAAPKPIVLVSPNNVY